mmetsp:Transcript_36136/g.43595  ORF Transcript_36136/g.43595 Transcript_36136/m.43595 type:complete len:185 (-) Transcript_36136:127-681(-)
MKADGLLLVVGAGTMIVKVNVVLVAVGGKITDTGTMDHLGGTTVLTGSQMVLQTLVGLAQTITNGAMSRARAGVDSKVDSTANTEGTVFMAPQTCVAGTTAKRNAGTRIKTTSIGTVLEGENGTTTEEQTSGLIKGVMITASAGREVIPNPIGTLEMDREKEAVGVANRSAQGVSASLSDVAVG